MQRWMLDMTLPDGSLVHIDDGNPGRGNAEWETSMTGLSLLAFCSAGYTTEQGKYREVVQRELEVLDYMTAERDKKVWAVAQGNVYEVDDAGVGHVLVGVLM